MLHIASRGFPSWTVLSSQTRPTESWLSAAWLHVCSGKLDTLGCGTSRQSR